MTDWNKKRALFLLPVEKMYLSELAHIPTEDMVHFAKEQQRIWVWEAARARNFRWGANYNSRISAVTNTPPD